MTLGTDYIGVVIPRRLQSPNRGTYGAHWSRKNREREAWQADISNSLLVLGHDNRHGHGWSLITGHATRVHKRRGLEAVAILARERRRVRIERAVPSRRNFIRDRDNRLFSAKPITDALKGIGLIYDDDERWTDLDVGQTVSPDGNDYTIITIERWTDAQPLRNPTGRLLSQWLSGSPS